ncbi:MAG: hypothetical protein CSA33_04980 [Desulfobulbus propionicus]|nr:MAG: hypothetical protein CSA33_04980 [Desulfobulbus propionicus]
MSLAEISKELKSVKNITEALLDVLIAVGLIEKKEEKFSLLQTANDFFLDVSKANIENAVKGFSGSAGPFDNLKEVLQEGPPIFNDRMWTGENIITSMEQQQYGGAIQNVLAFIRAIPEFKTCKKMCDFAGSVGYFSFEFIQENPQIESHVYDLPEVCDLAKKLKKGEKYFHRSIIELITRCMGYPTHQLPEIDLKNALKKAGFGEFRTKYLANEAPYPTLLLSAVKIMDI